MSLERMAELLRTYPEFDNIDRSTISRWFKKPSKRTALAIRILRSKIETRTVLRIAHPEGFFALPSLMLTWPQQEGKPYGILKQLWNVEMSYGKTKSFREARRMMTEGQIDVTLLPSYYLRMETVSRLCSIVMAATSGFTTKTFGMHWEWKDLGRAYYNVIYPSYDEIRRAVSKGSYMVDAAYPVLPPVEIEDPEECAEQIVQGKFETVVGVEPFVSLARKEVKNRGLKTRSISSDLHKVEFGVEVNIGTANPQAIRAYLAGLSKTTEYIQKRKDSKAFHEEVAVHLGRPTSYIADAIMNSDWGVMDLHLATVLTLWEREVTLISS